MLLPEETVDLPTPASCHTCLISPRFLINDPNKNIFFSQRTSVEYETNLIISKKVGSLRLKMFVCESLWS